jgi:hypothetical protein
MMSDSATLCISDARPSPFCPKAANAEAGEGVALPGGRGLACVERIAPVDGWSLFEGEYRSFDELPAPFFYAVRGGDQRLLNVSSYFFEPTQARFAWLVRHGFPNGVVGTRGAICPLSNASIDAAIAAESAEDHTAELIGRVLRLWPCVEMAAAGAGLLGFALIAANVVRGVVA